MYTHQCSREAYIPPLMLREAIPGYYTSLLRISGRLYPGIIPFLRVSGRLYPGILLSSQGLREAIPGYITLRISGRLYPG